jgi:hypothetical protein
MPVRLTIILSLGNSANPHSTRQSPTSPPPLTPWTAPTTEHPTLLPVQRPPPDSHKKIRKRMPQKARWRSRCVRRNTTGEVGATRIRRVSPGICIVPPVREIGNLGDREACCLPFLEVMAPARTREAIIPVFRAVSCVVIDVDGKRWMIPRATRRAIPMDDRGGERGGGRRCRS